MTKVSIIAAAAVIAALPGAAFAADPLIYDDSVAFVETSVFDWSGFYIGGTAGYSSVNADYEHVTAASYFGGPGGLYENEAEGFVGGGFAGANLDLGGFVIGAEFAYLGSNVEGNVLYPVNNNTTTDIDQIMTAKVRAGLGLDRFLVYGSAGLASVHATAGQSAPDGNMPDGFRDWSDDEWLNGFTVGAGIDVAVTDNIFVGAAYDFTSVSGSFSAPDEANVPAHIDGEYTSHTITGRIGLKF